MSVPNFKVGDIITAYHKGYHQVLELYSVPTYNGRINDLVRYKLVLNSNFTTKGANVERKCNVLYCEKVTKESITKWANEQAEFYLNGAREVIKLL